MRAGEHLAQMGLKCQTQRLSTSRRLQRQQNVTTHHLQPFVPCQKPAIFYTTKHILLLLHFMIPPPIVYKRKGFHLSISVLNFKRLAILAI